MLNFNAVRNLNRLAAALALLLLTFACLFGWQTWQSEKADQINQLRTVLELGQRAIDQYFVDMEAGLKWLSEDLIGPDGQVGDAARATRRLKHFRDIHPELSAVNLVGIDGQILASSEREGAGPLPSLAGEPSFRHFLGELTPQTNLALGRPLLGKISQRWITPLRFVIRDAQGKPAYILAGSMPVELLQSFWKSAPIMSRAAVGLMRDDGFLLSRYPLPPDTPLEEAYGKPRSGSVRQHLLRENFPQEGYVEGINQLGGAQAGNVYRRLSHFPVTMFVSMPISGFRTAWWQRVQAPLAMLVLLGMGGWLGYLYTRSRQAAWDAERRQTEENLRASEAEQRFLIDHILAGVVVHGPDGAVTSGNSQACRLLGLTPAQMLGREVIDPGWRFIHEDGSPLPVSEYPVVKVMSALRPTGDFVLGIVRTGGAQPVWALGNAYPEFGPDGVLRQIVVTFVDITARRAVENELLKSESRYRMLFENSMDAVLQTRPDGTILAANDAACRLFGMTETELIQRGREGAIDPKDSRLDSLLRERALKGRAAGELTMLRGDGSPFEAEISSAVYTDKSGESFTSLVVRDMSEQRRIEAAMLARDIAEQANRAKSGFIARMSHELRTPLNAILGFSEVLQLDDQHPLTRTQREQLGHVRHAGDHLLHLINDLLDLSRIEAGALLLQLEDIDVTDVACEAVRDVSSEAERHAVRIVVNAPAGQLPPARADRTRLRQVMLNLLSNAIKYTRQGGEVAVRIDADTDAVRLRIVDTGLGMTSAQLDALFEPFNRLGRESSAIEGTGIGLVITRGLVELMGGQLLVRSEPGKGSEFTVVLPATGASADAAHHTASGGLLPLDRTSVTGRVLYIDDDEVNRLLMQAFLAKRPGIALSTVGDGPAGIAMALAAPPDLMLIDMMMPGMDGMQVMKAVRAEARLRHTRCVAVSANAMPSEIEAAISEGFDGYLTKPISLQSLLAEVDRCLS